MLTIRIQPPGFQPPSSHEVSHGPFDVGRSPATDDVPRYVVTNDQSVSRNHVRVVEKDQDVSVVAGWFETLIAVQRAPAGSKPFYEQTAQALVEQIGMDVGLVLLKKPNGWTVTARHASVSVSSRAETAGREFSMTVLDKLAREKRTIYQSDEVPMTESLAQVNALVASPVLLPSGEVAGALYGVRGVTGV